MYLSKLDVVGFKSFANKVHLDFDAGITAIVGPNGCGKTNVVDAIRWALGEQKPSTLRSDKMEDVIFNGTKNRKPIGMADVSLTIENTKGILPIEYSEVTITRRVYRSGESEYYLNKTLCRLKDIKDLFMDTGMGSDAYSVIELKMVETILSDRTEERRRLFEEAAGVTKYKHRRKEAYRRLDSVQQDLVRVNDVVKEVQKAVNSLERQAQKAERFNELTKSLRQFEMALLERDYGAILDKIGPLKDSLVGAVGEKERIDNELVQEELLLEELRAEMAKLESQLTETQSVLSDQQQQINLAQQRQISAAERKKSLLDAIERYEKERVDLQVQQKELDARSHELRALIEQTHVKVQEAALNDAAKREELDAVTVQLDAKKADVRALQEKILGAMQAVSNKRQEHERMKARIENIHGRIDFSSEENSTYGKEIEEIKARVRQLSAEDKELRRQSAEAEVRLNQKEEYRSTLESEIAELKNKEFDTRTAMEHRFARLDFIKSLVESYDGFSEGAKFLITNDAWKANVETTVADALSTEAKYRIAIEAALGEASGYIVVKNVEEAYRGIEVLKEHQKGRATFICLNRVPPPVLRQKPISADGVIGWAKDVIECESAYTPMFDYLMENTLVVRDAVTAFKYVNTGVLIKCVTLDGEIISSQGVMKGGSVRSDEGGRIGKKKQIDELAAELGALESTLAQVRMLAAAKEEALRSLDIKSLVDNAKRVEQQKTAVEMRIAQIEFEKKRMNENIQRNIVEGKRLQEESVQLQRQIDAVVPAITKLEADKSAIEHRAGAAASELETMEVMWNEFSGIAHSARVALLNLENEEKNFARELEYTRATLTNVVTSISQREKDSLFASSEITRLADELASTDHEISSLSTELSVLVESKRSADADYNRKRNQMHSIELKIKDERRLHDDSMGRTHALEIKLSELTMRAEAMVQRAKDEFMLVLVRKEFPPEEIFDFETAREEIRTVKEKIGNLGAVNFAAFDEFTTEKARLDFITTQRADLLEAEKTLVETIEEINTTAKNTFNDTFIKIRDNFIATFKSLFDEGDECDLRLEDGVDPLEARIEIIAKPRGKRPTSIDLLSGGEKTLTAIALLFAIYLVKPSPFCILDEVDAPLDDSNIDRFSRIIRKFSDNTQFIVVTHNKRTMEAANAMYGVTMEEEGVSKLVSVRFNENKIAKN